MIIIIVINIIIIIIYLYKNFITTGCLPIKNQAWLQISKTHDCLWEGNVALLTLQYTISKILINNFKKEEQFILHCCHLG